MTPEDLEKVRSPKLRAMAQGHDPATAVAIVKVAAGGGPALTFRKSEQGFRPFGVEGVAGAPGHLEQTRAALEAITGRPARLIASAEAVVVEADGAQLRAIAELPGVEHIYSNEA